MIIRSNSRRRRQRASLVDGGVSSSSALLLAAAAAAAAAPMMLLLLSPPSLLLESSLPWSSFLTLPLPLVLRVDAAAADDEPRATLTCAGGWDSSSSAGKMVEIPKSWINDGYCDCPYDGLDEPDTEACSGSSSWPGIISHSQADEDDDDGKKRHR